MNIKRSAKKARTYRIHELECMEEIEGKYIRFLEAFINEFKQRHFKEDILKYVNIKYPDIDDIKSYIYRAKKSWCNGFTIDSGASFEYTILENYISFNTGIISSCDQKEFGKISGKILSITREVIKKLGYGGALNLQEEDTYTTTMKNTGSIIIDCIVQVPYNYTKCVDDNISSYFNTIKVGVVCSLRTIDHVNVY